MFRKFSQWFDAPPTGKATYGGGRACEHFGCQDEGIYRAPKSRYHLETGVDDWHWFCLIHVRDYNAKWNYYNNMSEAEIEQERRADVTWQRPSWPLGASSGSPTWPDRAAGIHHGQAFQDPFGLFDDLLASTAFSQDRFVPESSEGKALTLFEITYPFSQGDLRKRYRDLVKQHHPDINGGTPEAVEKLKRINEAYEILKRLY